MTRFLTGLTICCAAVPLWAAPAPAPHGPRYTFRVVGIVATSRRSSGAVPTARTHFVPPASIPPRIKRVPSPWRHTSAG